MSSHLWHRHVLLLLRGICLVWLISPSTSNAQPAHGDTLRVVASFSILADLVQAVGGERITLHSLIGREQDGHVFQPRPSDLTALRQADLVFINGLGFEGWITRAIQSAGYRGPTIVASDGIEPLMHGGDPQRTLSGHKVADPHAWQDPWRVKTYVRNIAQALATADPQHATYYAERAQAFLSDLEQLDQWIRARLEPLPSSARILITTHAAMQYFGERYALQFLAAQGLSTASEPGAREVALRIQQVQDDNIAAIFAEGPNVPAMLQQISRETGVPIQGRLFTDTLSHEDGPAASYLEMMRYNTQRIVDAAGIDPG